MNVYLSKESYSHYVAVGCGNKSETHYLLHTYTVVSVSEQTRSQPSYSPGASCILAGHELLKNIDELALGSNHPSNERITN